MSHHRCTPQFAFVSLAAGLLWAASSANAFAQCGGHGGMGEHDHAAMDHTAHEDHSSHQYHFSEGVVLPKVVQRTPHGGLFLEDGSHLFEVVYLPQELRVYLYEASRQPLSAGQLRGEMSPRVRYGGELRPIPLQFVPQPAGSGDQDYLAAAIDLTQLPDETPISFRFENLPDRKHPEAEFTPVFSRSDIRPYVARVSIVQEDGAGIAQQQVCPVTGARLGSMGYPVKVLVGDSALYLCCTGCIDRVQETTNASLAGRPAPDAVR